MRETTQEYPDVGVPIRCNKDNEDSECGQKGSFCKIRRKSFAYFNTVRAHLTGTCDRKPIFFNWEEDGVQTKSILWGNIYASYLCIQVLTFLLNK